MAITVPLEDGYETTLTQELLADALALTIYVAKVPQFTFPSGKEVVMTIEPRKGFTRQENVIIESYDAVAKTLTVKSGGRAQARYNGDTPTPIGHPVGSKIILSDPYVVWDQLSQQTTSGGEFTGPVSFTADDPDVTFQVPNMTETERDLIASPENGMLIYNTTSGEFQIYDGGVWQAPGAASVPNGSDTVAGIWQGSTVADQGAQASTGSTGAGLVLQAKNLVKTSSGASDENKIAILNSSGNFADGFISTTTKERLTESRTFGESINDRDAVSINLSGEIVQADGNDQTRLANYVGISGATASSGANNYFPKGPIVDGMTLMATAVEIVGQSTESAGLALSTVTQWLAQSFLSVSNQSLTEVTFEAYKSGSPTGNVSVDLYTTTGGDPDTLVTNLGSFDVSTLATSTSGKLITIDRSGSPVDINSTTTYALVFDTSGVTFSGGDVRLKYNDATDDYTGGDLRTSGNSGANWSTVNYDLKFTVDAKPRLASYFLSDTAGGLSSVPGTYYQKVGNQLDDSHLLLVNDGPILGATYSFSTGTVNATVDTEIFVGFRAKFIQFGASNNAIKSASAGLGTFGVWASTGYQYCIGRSTLPASSTSYEPRFGVGYIGSIFQDQGSPRVTVTFEVLSVTHETITIRRVVSVTGTPLAATLYVTLNIHG